MIRFGGAFLTMLSLACLSAFSQGGDLRYIKLNSGHMMPALGLGTWTLRGKTCEDAVYAALKSGYRLIDTARYYGNEAEVGRAVRRAISEGICKREDVFVTTKLLPSSSNPQRDIESSIANLGLGYIDLILLHQHGSNDNAVYRAMVEAVKEGKARSIGISNFYTRESVEYFIRNFEIPPAVVQNENHLYYQNAQLKGFAAAQGITLQSYFPLGGRGHTREHFSNSTIAGLAAKHRKTPAQIILRWHLQAGYSAVPGSSNPNHIAENIGVFDFALSEEEMKSLYALDTGKRYENW